MVGMNKLLEIALQEYGVSEVPGPGTNARILQYLQELGSDIRDDETPWCSIFMSWVAKTAGYEYSQELVARSWLKLGDIVTDPKLGDIVIFWRVSPRSYQGHVGIYICERNGLIYCLGGNQNNRVSIDGYVASRVLGYRRLRGII
jgi:uncharacterized protein (TIGR02594 family)